MPYTMNRERNIWLLGGGELLSKMLNAGLVDEMHIFYIPIILGQGISLFPDQTKLSKWILKQSKVYDKVTFSQNADSTKVAVSVVVLSLWL